MLAISILFHLDLYVEEFVVTFVPLWYAYEQQ